MPILFDRRSFLSLLLVIATFLLVFLLAGGASGSGAKTIGLPDCTGRLTVRPASIVLACADGNFQARSLQWTGWGQAFAAARGIASVNDCTPNCAAGHFHTYPAFLVVSGHQSCSGRPAYSSVTYAFPATAPFHVKTVKDATLPFRCR